MRLHLRTTSPRKHSADGCEVRREPRPLKEERKCLGVAEQEKLVKVGRGAAGGVAERRGTPCRHKAAAIFGGSPGTCWEPGGRRACGGAAAGRPWPPGNRISSRCPFCRGSSMSAEVPEAASAEEQKVSVRGEPGRPRVAPAGDRAWRAEGGPWCGAWAVPVRLGCGRGTLPDLLSAVSLVISAGVVGV